jgi:FAD/FMN-containing dehydrogenase/Fe-S oxidoreductase
MTTPAAMRRLEARLAKETRAEVRFDAGYRGLYSTDASLYQIEPIGVALPRVTADVAQIVRLAAEEGISIVPRGGATSLSGQTVGTGLIIDFSKYLNRISVIDLDQRLVRVEPGVVLDQLNDHVSAFGLMFGPDVSTSDRATIGGMIGNNSAGARSLRYGKTVDHVHSLEVVLDDGTRAEFGPIDPQRLDTLCAADDRVGRLSRCVRDEVARHESAIRERFPRILRRVSGYNLDEFVPGMAVRPSDWPDEPWRFNLARLVVGSEGTLAVVAGATLRLVPKPKVTGLLACSFDSIKHALECVGLMLEARPSAVEMLDRMILDLAAAQPDLVNHLCFVSGRPEALLAVQFMGESDEQIAGDITGLRERLTEIPGFLGAYECIDAATRASFWKVRKAGLALLMGMVGDAKPVAFVEDTAVDPARLPEFYERFRAIVARHGASASCYGHADVGCLHIRPILDMKHLAGVAQMRAIARDVSGLVREFNGAMSGEHGDGLARSRWNRPIFGDEVYGVFHRIKREFDPFDRLNPGKLVAEPELDANLRIGPEYRAVEPVPTAFDFSNQGGFARAVELCSGVGVCRKTDVGTMCPSYMVTRDEEHTTRGRANALRLVLTGELTDGFANATLSEAIDLCLQCKACKSECPSNVDMAKLKAESLHQLYKSSHVPFPALAMAYLDQIYRIASPTAPLANALARSRSFRWLLEKLAGIDRRRIMPAMAPQSLRSWFRRRRPVSRFPSRGEVLLFDDCFTNYLSPQVGRSAVNVLEAAGYCVRLANVGCCGRTAISKGVLDRARSLAASNIANLAPLARQGTIMVGCEPSCLLTFADEYREFGLGSDAVAVAESVRLVEDFIADRTLVPDLNLSELNRTVLLHGHCHQKASVGTHGSEAALSRIPGVKVRTLDSGCCGMAGSFGYELGHYDVSEALARRVLLPAIAAEPGALIAAPGFSCRSQVLDLENIQAQHPVEILASALKQS